tara:strand:- start:14 stop:667 length:654 start_codon:yes stop_codon:yes gene_type:complete
MNKTSILRILNSVKTPIVYTPQLNKITGSVTATILLQHLLYLWFENDRKAFYRYKMPNKQDQGVALCDELGFSRREFDTALSKISTKVDRLNVKVDTCVKHSVDFTRKTWYYINEPVMQELVGNIFTDYEVVKLSNVTVDVSPFDLLKGNEMFLEQCKMQIKGNYNILSELQKYSDHVIFKGTDSKNLKQHMSGFRNWLRNHMRMNLSSTGERKMIM